MKHVTFHTTHWSVVLAAKGDDTKARAALSKLCTTYRGAIVRYIEGTITNASSCCYGGRNAEDLAHDFLIQLLEGKLFERIERCEGSFRAYLLRAVRYFLLNARRQESTERRGGNIVQVPIHNDIPQTADAAMFDRDWARAMVGQATVLLGDSPETQMFLPWLTREMTAEDRERIAEELGKSESAIKVALHRLRKRFRQHVRELITHTVGSAEEIDAELDHLIRALSR